MIRHDNVPADGDIVLRIRAPRECHKCGVHGVRREQFPTSISAASDEEQGDAGESIAGAAGVSDIHARECCSRFPVGSATRICLTISSLTSPRGATATEKETRERTFEGVIFLKKKGVYYGNCSMEKK
jgi:hypothetical protein